VLATADRYFSFTLATQPALTAKSPRFHELSFFKSTSCSGCCSAFATQSGVSARTVASWALVVAILPARRLKTLKGLTPYEFICKRWTSEPDRFMLDPLQQMLGLNN